MPEKPAASRFSREDIFLFNEGTHNRIHDRFGAHAGIVGGVAGTHFAVWAPNARTVSVIGSFNGWHPEANPLELIENSGIWVGFVAGVQLGALYKYHVVSRIGGYTINKADPVGFMHQVPPDTASIVWHLDYHWNDADWLKVRRKHNAFNSPLSIYEVHLGSWRRVPAEGGRSLSYREMSEELPAYVQRMGFTHVEFLPVMEHPFFGSWGYQLTGYFAPTSRYGTPQDFMLLVDRLHQAGIGVILDWVPSHFPSDGHGLAFFDGTHLYEHDDPRQGFHPDWNSFIFNYGRNEVRSFLLSSARHWLETFHADALRVDAVASMLYRDYSRKPGEWVPNEFGGRENLEAISFLRRLNCDVYQILPDTQTVAEESTAWPMVSRPTYLGGLGFGMKWDMGWMHDSLQYMSKDPVHRGWHHGLLTFRLIYAYHENFILPLSHDEVVHGKGSLLRKMFGDEWQRFANLRLLLGYMFTQPGKKLLFMGGEFAQWREWNHDGALDWQLLDRPAHSGVQRWVADLNALYRSQPAVHALDFDARGFQWIDANDARNSTLSYLRTAGDGDPGLLVLCNFTPILRTHYRVGVPAGGFWREILNSDAHEYGGSGAGNFGGQQALPSAAHGRPFSLDLTLPPYGLIVLQKEPDVQSRPNSSP
jgi:1,4-alpha-glucan branching enzyme